MKWLAWNFLIVGSLAFVLPHTATSQDTTAGRLSVPAGNTGGKAVFSADSIVREDPPNPGPSPFASVIHLKGHVELRTCCVQRPQSRSDPAPERAYMILRADEADYYGDTGEIDARGEVHVNFQPAR